MHRMKLIITIDTEEDNWGSYNSQGHTLKNIERIPDLQRLFDEFQVKPTYLVTYPAATHREAVSILRPIYEEGRCDIGAQCHPWNTPPFEEEINKVNSMLCNLPPDLQYKKMESLRDAIQKNLGVEPISFRSGRWGYSREVAQNLHRLGYTIDTSITPYTDWTESHGPDFTQVSPQPFRFSTEDIFRASPNGHMLEVPPTIAFLQRSFALSNTILGILRQKPFNRLRLIGLLHRLRLLEKIWLSPEISDGQSMIRLARRMMRNHYKVINLFFHSPSLVPGLTPFVKTEEDEGRFLQHLREFLTFARDEGIEPIKLSEALRLI